MKLTNVNIPARFTDDDFKDKQIKRFRLTYPDMIVFKQSYDSEKELEKDKAKWDMMGYEQRLIANEKSIQLFGHRNEDRYPALKAKFTKMNIENTEVPKTYSPSERSYYNEEFSDYSDTFKHSLRLSEEWNKPLIYLNAIEESTDILERLYLIESMKKLDTSKSTIGKQVKKYAYGLREELLARPEDETQPIGYCKDSFFTPREIIENGINVKDKKWFNEFQAKCYGLETTNEQVSDEDIDSLFGPVEGNDIVENRKIISNRLNEAISKEVFTNRRFVDLSEINTYGVITEDTKQNIKGITIYFLYSILSEEDPVLTTRIGIGLDTGSDEVYEFKYGDIVGKKTNLKNLAHNKNDFIIVYFLPMEDDLYDKISEKINDMVTKNYHVKNFLRDVFERYAHKPIVNDKLYYVYLIHLLISMSTTDDKYIDNRLPVPNKQVYSYILYKGEFGDYKIEEVFSKLNMYNEQLIDKKYLAEGYFKMPKLDLQVLLESNDTTTEDKTGFSRIKYKDFSKTLSRYTIE